MAGQVGHEQPPPAEERHHRLEVPRCAAEAVDQEERRAFPRPFEHPHAHPTVLVEAWLEALQQVRRIRHVDRLFSVHCEFDGDKAGRVKIPVLAAQGAGALAR